MKELEQISEFIADYDSKEELMNYFFEEITCARCQHSRLEEYMNNYIYLLYMSDKSYEFLRNTIIELNDQSLLSFIDEKIFKSIERKEKIYKLLYTVTPEQKEKEDFIRRRVFFESEDYVMKSKCTIANHLENLLENNSISYSTDYCKSIIESLRTDAHNLIFYIEIYMECSDEILSEVFKEFNIINHSESCKVLEISMLHDYINYEEEYKKFEKVLEEI